MIRTEIMRGEWFNWVARVASTQAWRDEATWMLPSMPNCLGCGDSGVNEATELDDRIYFSPCGCIVQIQDKARPDVEGLELQAAFEEAFDAQAIVVLDEQIPDGVIAPAGATFEEAMGLHEFVDTQDERVTSDRCLKEACGRPKPGRNGGDIHRTRRWLLRRVESLAALGELEKVEYQRAKESSGREIQELKARNTRLQADRVQMVKEAAARAEEAQTTCLRLRQAIWGIGHEAADEYANPELARLIDKRVIELDRDLTTARNGIKEALQTIPEAIALIEGITDGRLGAQAQGRLLTLLLAATSDLGAAQ